MSYVTKRAKVYTFRASTPTLSETHSFALPRVISFNLEYAFEQRNLFCELRKERELLFFRLVISAFGFGGLNPNEYTFHISPVYKPSESKEAFRTNDGGYSCSISTTDVEYNGRYEFDIVVKNGSDLSPKYDAPPEPARNSESNFNFPQIMSSLLMDIYSADICLSFDSENNLPCVGLWAHRVILSRFQKFNDLIQEAVQRQYSSSNSANGGSSSNYPVIPIGEFSLRTMLALIRYIYTGEVELKIDLNSYVLSSFETPLMTCVEGGKKVDTQIGPAETWELKDVIWKELLEAAHFFGIECLKERCETVVINKLEMSTVLDTLFETGVVSSKVKEASLSFIAKNKSELMKAGKNPFDAYKNHPKCHEYMFEVMQLICIS